MNLLNQTEAQRRSRLELARVLMQSPTARRLVCPPVAPVQPIVPQPRLLNYDPTQDRGVGIFGKTYHGD